MSKSMLMTRRGQSSTLAKSSLTDGNGNYIHNEILLSLSSKESEPLLPKLELVRLRVHHVLHETGDALKSFYFCNSGMISILSVFPDGKSVEVGLVGREGVIGMPLLVGFRTAPTTPTDCRSPASSNGRSPSRTASSRRCRPHTSLATSSV